MRQIAVIAVLCLGLSAPAWADGPSFDCAKATTPVEKAICASGDLSALDRQIADEYEAALSGGLTNAAQQRAWLTTRNKACAPQNATDCLRAVLMDRHAFLSTRKQAIDASQLVRGHPSFDCAKAAGRTEKAICANQRLSELDVALVKAYAAARREHLYLVKRLDADEPDWQTRREEDCVDHPDGNGLFACLEGLMLLEIEKSSRHAEFDEAGRTVKYAPYNISRAAELIDSDSEVARITSIFSERAGAKVENCAQTTALFRKDAAGHKAADYGAFCTINAGGKKTREVVCSNTALNTFRHLDPVDRPIAFSEVATFTFMNCQLN